MLIEFTISIEVEPEDKEELSEEQYKEMDQMCSDFEEIIAKKNYSLNEAVWQMI